MVFPEFKASTSSVELIIDIVWTFDICLKFLRPKLGVRKPTMKSVAKSYVLEGSFFIDLIATVPPMITGEKYTSINFLKYLRMWHYFTMMFPVKALLILLNPNSNSKKIKNIFDFMVLILTILLLAHFMACIWIFLGKQDNELPAEERQSWALHPDSDFIDYTDF